MTRRLVGALIAGAFALGFLGGAAGTIVAHDTTTPTSDHLEVMAEHMAGYDMDSWMSGSMGSMMGPGSSFGAGMMNGTTASGMPGSQHELHHPAESQGGTR